VIGTLAVDG